MKRSPFRLLLPFLCTLAAALRAAELPPPAARPIDFVKDVQPLLAKNCYECHGEKKQKAELRWDVKGAAIKGGEHGPAIVPGKSAESLMIQLVAGLKGADMRMPAKG
ncbi:MAG TPA: c-type cytochrome domain-containing protein, partial [Verrucomicrobiae bacterium]